MSKQNKYERRVERKTHADEREARTGMRQSYGAMIAKICAGLLFIIVGFTPSGDKLTLSDILFGMVIGGGLIAWGLGPYLNVIRKRKREDELHDKQILGTPLEKFGDKDPFADQAEELAKHYEKKE